MRIFLILCSIIALVLLSGCETTETEKIGFVPVAAPLLQTREFACPKQTTMAAAIKVLYGSGYTITNTDYNMGLISGETNRQSRLVPFKGDVTYYKGVSIYVSAENENLSSVRVQMKTTEIAANNGVAVKDQDVSDPAVYESFFDALSKNLNTK